LIDTEQLGKAIVSRESRHTFRDVHGTSTAQANQSIMATLAKGAGAIFDQTDFRLWLHLVVEAIAAATQVDQSEVDCARFDQNRIGHDQWVINLQPGQPCSVQLFNRASAGQEFIGDLKGRNAHRLILVFLLEMYQMDNKTCANVVKYPSLTDFVSFVQGLRHE
jgi:hypothetical protein